MTKADIKSVINEAMLKQQSVIDSGSECPIITYEVAKKLGFEKDRSLPDIADKVVSDIVNQVSGKKIRISLHKLLEIVKPEIGLEIIDLIANPDISRQHIPCKARKKPIFNDTASESSSTSESGSGSESSYDNEDFTVKVVKAKKRD